MGKCEHGWIREYFFFFIVIIIIAVNCCYFPWYKNAEKQTEQHMNIVLKYIYKRNLKIQITWDTTMWTCQIWGCVCENMFNIKCDKMLQFVIKTIRPNNTNFDSNTQIAGVACFCLIQCFPEYPQESPQVKSPWSESMSQLMRKLDRLNLDIEEALSASSSPSDTPCTTRKKQVRQFYTLIWTQNLLYVLCVIKQHADT